MLSNPGKSAARRPLPLTPLIDVVFLLLLFFMLASTFDRSAEVKLSGGLAGAGTGSEAKSVLVRLSGPTAIDLNGTPIALSGLGGAIARHKSANEEGLRVLVLVKAGAKVQQVVDVLEHLSQAGHENVQVVK